MAAWRGLVAGIVCASTAWAQAPAPDSPPAQNPPKAAAPEPPQAPPPEDIPPPKAAPSRVTAVTVYQGNALVTREVAVPEGKGLVELVVTPLPPQTVAGSLSAEAGDGIRVLSTRYRTRAVREDTRQEVRAREEEIKTLAAQAEATKKELEVLKQDQDFLGKLEGFTGASLQNLMQKGRLDGEATIGLSDYVMEARAKKATAQVAAEERLKANAEAAAFAQRQLAELSAGSSRTEIDAVVVVDKADAPAGTVRLSYLVGAATWRPQYRLRAGGEKDPVQLEYLAAVEQQSGEEWPEARLTLSTAQPTLSATLPDLLPLDITADPVEEADDGTGRAGLDPESAEQYRAKAREYRGKAREQFFGNDAKAGTTLLNQAAALDQAQELLTNPDDDAKPRPTEGPSVSHKLKGLLTVPSRRDPLLVEVKRFAMPPEFFAKAVPVLSPRVYRLAKLTNTGDEVILPGEATMYVGSDFVGRMTLPQVAVGEQFVAGFGVDPQLQIGRRLVKKARAVQGGNQVLNYEFRIVVRNFKSTPVNLQVWDRLPRAEVEAVAVSLTETQPPLSKDPLYERTGRADNLLRWDLTVPPGTVGEKALPIVYGFKLEYARRYSINYLTGSDLKEAPIGGSMMGGGMGGGFRSR